MIHLLMCSGDHEVRCVKQKSLMEALAKELPNGTINYSSKVVSIEESGYFKLLHLADGSILKTKVLIGCDGVNSIVAKYLGLKKPESSGRYAIRGCADSKFGHETRPEFMQFFGEGVRSGLIPCDHEIFYWFFTWTPPNELEEDPIELKQFMLSKLGKVPEIMREVIANTSVNNFLPSPLRYRNPWNVVWGNISKGNVCVAGDALHPMTPDIGQGGCSAIEDGVVLARCLGAAILGNSSKPRIVIRGLKWH